MDWRPDNWEELIDKHYPEYTLRMTAFEAGANAILEALITKGERMTYFSTILCKSKEDEDAWQEGWLVFIPDKE